MDSRCGTSWTAANRTLLREVLFQKWQGTGSVGAKVNNDFRDMYAITKPSDAMYAMDANSSAVAIGATSATNILEAIDRHQKVVNAVYIDGHVESLEPDTDPLLSDTNITNNLRFGNANFDPVLSAFWQGL